jgi:polyhydroxyalkanoate synthase
VFLISWVNPDARLAGKGFEDYLTEGTLAAVDAIERQTGAKQINAVGCCLGGTLLAILMAYMAAHKDTRIASGTFLATTLNFAEPGELGVFIDEKSVRSLEKSMKRRGYLDGSQMASAFNMMRSNDLIWNYVVHNYLLGKPPTAFDMLFWEC